MKVQETTIPCPDKLNLLNAFCAKVRDLHMASRHLSTLVLSSADARDIRSAKIRCQTLRTESGGIQKWYDEHDFHCPSCSQLTLRLSATNFKATA